MKFEYRGRCPISTALATENQILTAQDNAVLGFEFDPVITLGRRAHRDRDVHQNAGVPVVQVHRGGQATLHNPGQLVIFPIVALAALGLSVRDFVESLTAITAATLSDLGIHTTIHDHAPGLYTEFGKIAFLGLRIRAGYATHGLAINVSNDLTAFASIRSCGIAGAAIDSVQSRGVDVGLEEVFSLWQSRAKTAWALDLDATQHYVSDHLTRSVGAVGSAFP